MATLSRFDTELKELDRIIKEKKLIISQIDLDLSRLQHEVQNLTKEKTTASNLVSKLEQQHDWIEQEKQLVSFKIVDVVRYSSYLPNILACSINLEHNMILLHLMFWACGKSAKNLRMRRRE